MATGDDEVPGDALALAPTNVDAADRAGPGAAMLREGDTVARYRIEGLLGRGGMGVVYRARDPELDRALAIKLVRAHRHGADRLLREAQAMARLDHPSTVPIFDVGLHGDQLYLVMPCYPGGTLGEWCRAAPRPWRDVVTRYIAAGRGLHAAHRAGLVHRDFKPDNVFLDGDGAVRVADFGLARATRDERDAGGGSGPTSGPLAHMLTQDGELLGTPAYMAPEQLDGTSVDARADQFSFCVALYEGLYGVRPFVLPPHQAGIVVLRDAMRRGQLQPVPADREVPRRVRDVILRGLRDAPEERWPSMDELVAQLQRALAGGPRRWRWIGLAALVALASALAVGLTRGRDPSPPSPSARMTARQLTFRGDVHAAALSPDGRFVAARAGQELIIVPVAAGAETRSLLRDFDQGERTGAIAWTPDSRQVMTVRSGDATVPIVELVDVATGASEQRALPVWPLAAMSGPREIASARLDGRQLRLTELDGGTPPRDCPLPGDDAWIFAVEAAGDGLFVTRYHADGSLSVVRTDRRCGTPAVVLPPTKAIPGAIDRDGSHVGALREHDGALVYERTPLRAGAPVWRSRALPPGIAAVNGVVDAHRLVATRAAYSWRLVRIAGDPARVIATLGVGSFHQFHAVSPDGTRVAVIDDRDGPRQALRVVAIDGMDARPAPLLVGVSTASWSTDGRRLAAMALRDGGADLAIVTVGTGATTRITLDDASPAAPVWLDDGRVAYLRADLRTYVAVELASRATTTLVPPDVGFTLALSVRPGDGALTWFWKHDAGGVFVQLPGQAPERVLPIASTTLTPVWSSDGRALWIRSSDESITRLDLATGERRRVFAMDADATEAMALHVPAPDGTILVDLTRESLDLVVLE